MFQVRKFKLGDYAYLYQTTLITLDMITGHVILWVQTVLHFCVLLLDGKND